MSKAIGKRLKFKEFKLQNQMIFEIDFGYGMVYWRPVDVVDRAEDFFNTTISEKAARKILRERESGLVGAIQEAGNKFIDEAIGDYLENSGEICNDENDDNADFD